MVMLSLRCPHADIQKEHDSLKCSPGEQALSKTEVEWRTALSLSSALGFTRVALRPGCLQRLESMVRRTCLKNDNSFTVSPTKGNVLCSRRRKCDTFLRPGKPRHTCTSTHNCSTRYRPPVGCFSDVVCVGKTSKEMSPDAPLLL